MNLQCSLKEGISQKSGNKYYYLSIMLNPSYEKKVFLDPADIEIIKLSNPQNKVKEN